MLVSSAALLIITFMIFSRYGSMHLFSCVSISVIVTRETFEMDERMDSASLIRALTILESYITFYRRVFGWCLLRRRIWLQASN